MRRLLSLLICLMLLCGCAVAQEAAVQPHSGITYEIFVASFADSDGNGVGDLQGITSKLDYLESLHVSRIWLTPIHPSPSYHHYDVLDYCDVAPAFGTLEDFDRLIAACNARGIDVLLDLVVNHTSSEHPWFKEACEALRNGVDSPYIQWYNFSQGHGDHVVTGTDWYYEGSFGYHMPDLNLQNEAVRAEIARIMTFWQQRGVKGFRLDAVTSYDPDISVSREFVRWLCQTAKANDPDCCLVGEVWADTQLILNIYGSGIDSLFNFPMADQSGTFIQGALNGKGASVARRMAEYQAQVRQVSPESADVPFLTNHDLARVRGMLRSDVTKMKAAAMLYLLMPGQPMIYYGDELGMSGSGKDENKRLPMLWGNDAALCAPPENADQNQRLKEGVDVQDADSGSLLNTYRALTALRCHAPELTHGVMTAIDTGISALCAYQVTDGDSMVVAAINASSTEALTVTAAQLLISQGTLVGSVGSTPLEPGAAIVGDMQLQLDPVSCMLIRMDP